MIMDGLLRDDSAFHYIMYKYAGFKTPTAAKNDNSYRNSGIVSHRAT